jgi:hypothetical protein
MQFVAITLLGLFSAVLYGVLHDQVTARVCVEYFTIGHPRIIESTSPTMLALAWGVVATWWIGLPLGVLLAISARAGRRPKLAARHLVRPILVLLAVMAGAAFVLGLVGFTLSLTGNVFLVGRLAEEVPADRHHRFLADLWAHNASYFFGFVGGWVVIGQTFWRRGRLLAAQNRAATA